MPSSMLRIPDLLRIADTYRAFLGIEEKTVSHRVFGDSKKLTALRTGSDISTGRFNGAFQWFSANWPADLAWPEGIERPRVAEGAQP